MRAALGTVVALCALAGCERPSQPPEAPSSSDGIVVTHHQVTVDGQVLRYEARAGFVPIRDDATGEAHGNMFFVSYTLDPEPGAPPRPLTFVWNGGPGSSSSLVHLLGFGPKRVARATGDAPLLSPAGTTLVDNDGTWLAQTDLVFVDPIGTGYSRPTKAAYEHEFYQSAGDAESVAEMIRVYRTRYDTFDQPLFLAGESYGVTRAALVAEALERRGTRVSGVIMLGLTLPLGGMPESVRSALVLPTFTAAAFANRKLPADLQDSLQGALHAAERWAESAYASDLERIGELSQLERASAVDSLARFTGLPDEEIDRRTLRVTMAQVSNGLLSDEGRVVGHYDSRKTGPRDTTEAMYDPTRDPSLKDILDPISVIRYLRHELGFESDLLYQGPFGGGYPPPTRFRGDWMSVKWDWSAPANDTALATALRIDPRLRVLIACGYFDMVCPFYGNEYAARHLPAAFSGRVEAHSYGGGHAIYTDDRARLELDRDVGAFLEKQASAAGAAR